MSRRRDQLRKEGEERNAKWRLLTPTDQLKELDRRLGKGLGATRQRRKLEQEVTRAVLRTS